MSEAIVQAILDSIFPGYSFYEGHSQLRKVRRMAQEIEAVHVRPLRDALQQIDRRILTADPKRVSDRDLLLEVRETVRQALHGKEGAPC